MSNTHSTDGQQQVKTAKRSRVKLAQAVNAGAVAVVEPKLDDDGPKQPKDRRGGLVGEDTPDGFTDKQWHFVLSMTEGQTAGNGAQSAYAAGYGEKNGGTIAAALLRLPHISKAIDAQLRAAIGGPLAAQSIQFLRRVLGDENANPKLRADIALKLVEFSGAVDRTKAEKTKETGLGSDKPMGEMSRADLERLVQAGAVVLAEAKTIEGQIAPNTDHAQLVEDAILLEDKAD